MMSTSSLQSDVTSLPDEIDVCFYNFTYNRDDCEK